jgi:hypothetical protein
LVVEAPLAFTEPLRVAPDVVTLVAADVTTVGALDDVDVVNDNTDPYVVPAELVATAWK